MSGKHPKTDTPTDADLKGNPGIGTSKGMSGADRRICRRIRPSRATSTTRRSATAASTRTTGRARTPDRAGVTARPGRPGPGDPGQRARAGGFGRWGAGPVANPADGPLAGT